MLNHQYCRWSGETVPATLTVATRQLVALPPALARELDNHLKSLGSEGCVTVIGVSGVELYADTEAAFFYARHRLKQLSRNGQWPVGVMVDYPNCRRRGVKLYLPAADKIDVFKEFIDFAASLQYNTVMLEIGGAMEYRKHPEINAGWIEYCKIMNEFPGKAVQLQTAFDWEKNSIHSENGGGNFLSQLQVKELIDYCRERHFEVIPEVPSLSHADYLLYRHPELAENPDDPYPDTYCPSNPDSYRLLFDVLDEVIEVFQSTLLNIGHDEFYTMARCESCRDKSGAKLYGDDVNRIADYLRERGVRCMLWAEKLLESQFKDGTPLGGSRREIRKDGKLMQLIPATAGALDRMPADLEILHWYWSIDRTLEDSYYRRNFPVTFGNFSGSAIPEWKKRRQPEQFTGVIISNWGTTDWPTLQRNGILFEMLFTCALCWNNALDSEDYPAIQQWTLQELYGRNCPPGDSLEVTHTTTHRRDYVYFVDGHYVDEKLYKIGEYHLRSNGGELFRWPVIYGSNIGTNQVEWERRISDASDCYQLDPHLYEASFSTLPGQSEGETSYTTRIPLPFPRHELHSVTLHADVPLTYRINLPTGEANDDEVRD